MNKLICEHMCKKALTEIASGDKTQLTVIYDCLGRQIFTLSLSILGNQSDAEDAMQDTFLKVLKHVDTYRKDGSATSWVLSIARNSSLDIMRKRRYDLDVDELPVSDEPSYTDGGPDVSDMLKCLDETDREIVTLKTVSGMKYKDIASVTGLSVAAVQKRHQRALEKLREYDRKESRK